MLLRRLRPCAALAVALVIGGVGLSAQPPEPALSFTKLWTFSHTTPGQLSEIPVFDPRTNTIWVAGVVGVDVLDAETGALVTHIDVTAQGAVNSVRGRSAQPVTHLPVLRSPQSRQGAVLRHRHATPQRRDRRGVAA
jgi:hypothetical protein